MHKIIVVIQKETGLNESLDAAYRISLDRFNNVKLPRYFSLSRHGLKHKNLSAWTQFRDTRGAHFDEPELA